MQSPELFDNEVITADGYHLPMRRWYPEGEGAPEAVVLGVHGFNDYSAAFEVLGRTLTQEGIAVYAYDQRGFGATDEKKRGIWAGQETLVSDLDTVARLLRARYPDTPLYIAGESMGGAVAITTLTSANPPPVDGAVLMAPAIWGRKIMPWYQRASLAVVRFIAPRLLLTGNMARRTGVRASDDIEVLYALGRDPLVQKGARVDTLYGLSELMNDALARAGDLSVPTLLLYGAKDEIIPPAAMCRLLSNVPQEHWPWRMVVYPQGFHMLTRYTGAATTQTDIAAWLHDVAAPLPSGDEMNREAARNLLCGAPTDQA